jgi:hypothetical protein
MILPLISINRRHLFFFVFLLGAAFSVSATDSTLPMKLLPAGEIKPDGWIKAQMLADLREGFAGHYMEFAGNVNHRLFETKSRKTDTKVPGDRGIEPSWWAGEHEGYWLDGLTRLAFYSGDENSIKMAKERLDAILAAQGPDGYIGIYDTETRLKTPHGSEAELWTQSRIFQALLGYYEFTGESRILDAVERAVQLTLSTYRPNSYFDRNKFSDTSILHGVGFVDPLENLYRLTGKACYRDAIVWLYRDYNKAFPDQDMCLKPLLNAEQRWQAHTPHLMECMPLVQLTAIFTGDPDYKTAANNALAKLAWHTEPGGGIVGDEAVHARPGTGEMYTEYCSLTEGTIAMNQVLAYRGDLRLGDWVERVCLNAAQGARLQTANRANAYLTKDDRRTTHEMDTNRDRILFSANHLAAACCTLNAMRLPSYYVQGMWLKAVGREALVANLYGPCHLATDIAKTKVTIDAETDYPFSDTVKFKVNPLQPAEFALIFRVPASAKDAKVEAGTDARVERFPERIEVTKCWHAGDHVNLDFDFDIRVVPTQDKKFFCQRGPLVYALKFPERMVERIKLKLEGKETKWGEYNIIPVDDRGWEFRIDPHAQFQLKTMADGDLLHPWEKSPMALTGTLFDEDGKTVDVTLYPEGATHLRRLTFSPQEPKDAKATTILSGTAGLMLHYNFDKNEGEVIKDQSGNQRDCKAIGGAWLCQGKMGGAWGWPEKSGRLECDLQAMPAFKAMSVELWVNVDQLPANTPATLFESEKNFLLKINSKEELNHVTASLGFNEHWVNRSSEVVDVLPVGTWQHVAATWDGKLCRVYINGVLQAESQAAGKLAPFRHCVIGQDLQGSVDDFKLYDRALNPKEIYRHARNPGQD